MLKILKKLGKPHIETVGEYFSSHFLSSGCSSPITPLLLLLFSVLPSFLVPLTHLCPWLFSTKTPIPSRSSFCSLPSLLVYPAPMARPPSRRASSKKSLWTPQPIFSCPSLNTSGTRFLLDCCSGCVIDKLADKGKMKSKTK